MNYRSIIVLPDDTIHPVIEAIDKARESLRIKMFLFSEPTLLNAVIRARKRGVSVKVMLNPYRHSGEEENEETKRLLIENDIEVKDSNPSFRITHEKSMVVDNNLAFIKSLNWERRNLLESRDYAIITSHPKEVEEVIECFECDWNRQPFDAGENAKLIWCRGNGRERIARFIDDAKHSLFVQNDRFQDMVIIERLIRAAARGVKVHVMARPAHSLKTDKLVEGVGGLRIMDDVGIKIHNLKHLRLHGKMLLADQTRAIVGSINLAPGSFDERRELAIEVHDEPIVDRLHNIAHHDWKHSYQLDLSDSGLFEDLEKRAAEEIAPLVLDPAKHDKNKQEDH
jgi:phosphatidylserine/phosphatidylglycerophosphate/cardiolipin synthase-like enzyme